MGKVGLSPPEGIGISAPQNAADREPTLVPGNQFSCGPGANQS